MRDVTPNQDSRSPGRLPDAIRARAAECPDAAAIVDGDRTWTYTELLDRAGAVARALRARQLGPGEPVGIAIDRSAESVAAIIAVLEAGAAYLPLDPAYPALRLERMAVDARLRYAIVQPGLAIPGAQSLAWDDLLVEAARTPCEPRPDPRTAGESAAYVIFTSGSTGRPKGVEMPFGPLEHLMAWQRSMSLDNGVPERARTLQYAALSFDVSAQEILSTLSSGGTLVIADEEVRRDGRRLARLIERERIDRLFLPVPALHFLTETIQSDPELRDRGLPSVREINVAGEALVITPPVRRFFEDHPNATLVNQYGPTETHVVTARVLDGDPSAWPRLPSIGAPLPHVKVTIATEDEGAWRESMAGAEGELLLGGACLANGYIHREELTASRFPMLELEPGRPERFYRTGDRVQRDPDSGELHYLGRYDLQVKIRGFRIELSEVESALLELDSVREAAVRAWAPSDSAERELVAVIVPRGEGEHPGGLRHRLARELTEAMIPTRFLFVDQLPKTPSGKIDRLNLPDPSACRPRPEAGVAYCAPQGRAEERIAAVWKELLGLEDIGATDPLFDLGATSVLAVRAVNRIRSVLPEAADLTAVSVFRAPTIRGIAAQLGADADALDVRRPPPDVRRGDERRPSEKIAVIGMAGRFPGARSVAELWRNLLDGVEGIRSFSAEELEAGTDPDVLADPDFVPRRGVVDGARCFDARFFGITPLEARTMDPQQRLFLETAWAALEDAGYAPERVDGRVGVFAGVGNNGYYHDHVLADAGHLQAVGAFPAMVANEKDYVATRVSHRMNLDGPSLSIHTACSTSLVAVCAAVRSLLAGECDLAIAGAASVTVPIESGYLHQEGGMLSRDGSTRPFDRDGSGTVFSDGAAAVILKPLARALMDGDEIDAVIGGVALNNDGADKASFTAPSVRRQAQVVAEAQEMAGVVPGQFGYVEAHGTATPLGDPVEVEALKLAFGRDGNVVPQDPHARTLLGSVKSNVGHLTAAAGVTGLIKAVLAVKTGTIPGTLHFREPNPRLGIEDSPFRVTAEAEPWPEAFERRVAGVSSFGVGGTNAHVVIEQPPLAEPCAGEPDRGPVVLPLSARTPGALAESRDRLLAWLDEAGDADPGLLSRVANTLQSGRRAFEVRAAVVASDREAAIGAFGRLRLPAGNSEPNGNAPLVWLFAGQGAQYPGMGSGLYERDAVFRAAVDECSEMLEPFMGEDLRAVMLRDGEESAEALKNTFYTQPSIFVLEYALAKVWEALGVRPDLMIGHSVGEFVAATLAGVFSLPEALRLVAARARLMAELPAGAMLSVRAPVCDVEAWVESFRPRATVLDLATVNAPQLSVVAGTFEDVQAFAKTLDNSEVVNKPLHTSHAFHSAMMDPAVGAFRAEADGVSLAEPRIPILSTVTADLMTAKEAKDPAYWSGHMRVPVRFSDAVGEALRSHPDARFLELGPRRVLSTLVRQQAPKAVAVPSLADQPSQEVDGLLHAVADLWSRTGADIDWRPLLNREVRPRRVHLPTYPFERTEHWIENPAAPRRPASQPATASTADDDMAEHDTAGEETTEEFSDMNAATVNERVREILTVLEEISGLELGDVPAETGFFEMGLDSLLLTQAANQLQRKFNTRITFRELLEDKTSPRLLAEHLSAHIAPAPERPVAAESAPVLRAVPARPDPEPEAPRPAFGAAARINTSATAELDAVQRRALEELQQAYLSRTPASKRYAREHRLQLADPRVVSGFRPLTKEMVYPIVVNRSQGSKLWDLDGNEYVDITCGFGSNFFGHGYGPVTEALKKQVDAGYEIGPQHPLAGEVAAMVCELTGSERAALCNTGSEAVLGALRLARTVTGRDLVVAFNEAYHGIVDEVIVRGTRSGKSLPAASGIPNSAVENMLVLDYDSPEALRVIEERADEIAAVLVEPVQSRRPHLQPREFLHELRRVTAKSGSALIFDEVITGFRIHPGGVQAHFGIRADIATYGKIPGGGMPIGAIAGRAAFMDALDGGQWQYGDDSMPTAGVTYFAGTFVRHPLALAAAKVVLTELREKGPDLQRGLGDLTGRMAGELNRFFEESGAPLRLEHFGSLFKPLYQEELPHADLLFYHLRLRGIHVWDARPCFLTLAHSEADVQRIVDAFKASVQAMQEAGFLPRRAPRARVATLDSTPASTPDTAAPPLPGARRGRNPQGQDGWYLSDPNRPGKWLLLEEG